MGRERQKRKNRSSRPKVRPKLIGRTKAGKKKVNFLGNETIAENWDRELTLEQNYKRLGLSTKLNSSVSGPRKIKGRDEVLTADHDSLAIAPNNVQTSAKLQEVRVERDPETGAILQIVEEEMEEDSNPLDDKLNELSDDEIVAAPGSENNIIAALEAQVEAEAAMEAKKKKPRTQSTREDEWITSLVEAHGDDYAAMFRDRKLNPMQQSKGDIARRVKKWKQKHS